MPLKVLELGKQFRPSTSVTYPPFKNGRYMEEYFYEYVINHKNMIESDRVYIPIFWTNIQNHPAFTKQKQNYEILLQREMLKLPKETKFFTVVQHDDGPQLKMPGDVLVFGACSGDIPLPLIYEDVDNKLLNMPRLNKKTHLASFVGSMTHEIRRKMREALKGKSDVILGTKEEWTSTVSKNAAELFIETTQTSKFCLSPRGYGRSSFRFFEAMLLDVVPVYFWNDIEWLPYKDKLDYTQFSLSISEKNIGRTYEILKSISDEKYLSMVEELKRVRYYFTLEGMSEYVIEKIKL